MSAVIDAGMPVEIGRIDKELGKLWESSDPSKTRASLINLVIYTEDASAVAANTELIAQIASEHACRALLVFANPSAPESQARAWISAHCHLAGKGERQICSEQITFQLDGDTVGALPNIVFSHLDSDLPLYLWWQGEFRQPLDEELWSWVNRLIFDSATWRNAPAQFDLARRIGSLADANTVLCDLNWTRLLGTRFALAQVFDHSCALEALSKIRKVSIDCAHRTTGALLLGWLAAQLGWKFQALLGEQSFVDREGQTIHFHLTEKAGADISRCEFECGGAHFELTREEPSDFYRVHITKEGVSGAPLLVSAGKSGTADILLSELGRGGRHPLYSKSLEAARALLQA